MKYYLAKTPIIIQKYFDNYTWKIAIDKKEIYLTFDDGPIPEITTWVLQTLAEFKAKATFFCIGDNISKYPDIFKEIITQNHTIGNHSFNHLNGWRTSSKRYLDNVEKAKEFIYKFKSDGYREQKPKIETKVLPHGKDLGWDKQQATNLFRPPYGKIRSNQSKLLINKGFKIIMWDVLSGDFDQNLSKENCLQNVTKNVNNGSIIVFHDSEKAFKNLEYTLPKTLEYFTKKGYVFKSL